MVERDGFFTNYFNAKVLSDKVLRQIILKIGLKIWMLFICEHLKIIFFNITKKSISLSIPKINNLRYKISSQLD